MSTSSTTIFSTTVPRNPAAPLRGRPAAPDEIHGGEDRLLVSKPFRTRSKDKMSLAHVAKQAAKEAGAPVAAESSLDRRSSESAISAFHQKGVGRQHEQIEDPRVVRPRQHLQLSQILRARRPPPQ